MASCHLSFRSSEHGCAGKNQQRDRPAKAQMHDNTPLAVLAAISVA
jgi:hypothetical protein